jgi:very-short-patch-repair endonuclease
MLPYNRKLKPRAQELRTNATPQEDKIWYQFLRKHDCRFTRQKTIGNYIADFYCHKAKLVIEIDGSQHYTDDGLEYDGIRTGVLENLGLHVMRFTNTEIDTKLEGVCMAIQEHMEAASISSMDFWNTPDDDVWNDIQL